MTAKTEEWAESSKINLPDVSEMIGFPGKCSSYQYKI